MSLITTYTNDTAGIQAKTKDLFSRMITNQYNNLVNEFNTLMNMVWSNPNGLTPQQVFDAFGTDAGQLVSVALGSASFINAIVANSVSATPPNGHTYTVNNDGTVTVTA